MWKSNTFAQKPTNMEKIRNKITRIRNTSSMKEIVDFCRYEITRITDNMSASTFFIFHQILIDTVLTWNVLIPENIKIIITLLRENMDQIEPRLVHIAAGSGFITKQVSEAMILYDLPFENIATDSKEEIIAQGFNYFPVSTATALETIEQYPTCRAFFVSRGRAFMLPVLQKILELHPDGPLIFILATEGKFGCCEPDEFFNILREEDFDHIMINNGLIEFSGVNKNDQLFIYYRNARVDNTLLEIKQLTEDKSDY